MDISHDHNLSLSYILLQAAKGGENLRLRLAGIDDDDIASGFVVCSRDAAVPAVTYFNAQLQARFRDQLQRARS